MTQALQKSNVQEIAGYLNTKKTEIEKSLPPGVNPERFIKTAVLAVMASPKIQKCTKQSVYQSVLQACFLDLHVGDGNNHAYLVEYNDWKNNTSVCQLQVGYRGWVKIVTESGAADLVHASVVYENDYFEFSELPLHVEHRPNFKGNRGDAIGSVAAAYKLIDGKHVIVGANFVTMDEIDRAKRGSQYKDKKTGQMVDSPAWKEWPDEMRKKVAIKRLCKTLPSTPKMQKLQAIEAASDSGVKYIDPDTNSTDDLIFEAQLEEARAEQEHHETEQQEAKKNKGTSSLKNRVMKPEVIEAEFVPPPSDSDMPPSVDVPDYGG